jgi:hypothetical protein
MFLIPRDASASKFANMVRRVLPREPHLTAQHARVLPVPDAIIQSDWQWQLAPTYGGGKQRV